MSHKLNFTYHSDKHRIEGSSVSFLSYLDLVVDLRLFAVDSVEQGAVHLARVRQRPLLLLSRRLGHLRGGCPIVKLAIGLNSIKSEFK